MKVLYGRAFRAPNSYELYYYGSMQEFGFTLEPETAETLEVVWEEYIGAHLRVAVSAFHYQADRLITQRTLDIPDGRDGGLYFTNDGSSTARGADGEIEGRWGSGLVAAAGYSYVRARDRMTGTILSNSPASLANVRLSAPITPLALRLGIELRGVGERRSLDGTALPGFFLGNVTATRTVSRNLDLELGVYNVLDTRYADPGAEEHLQRAIAQDGRTARVRVVASF
jgi:iron complex outermembrane receptor protein